MVGNKIIAAIRSDGKVYPLDDGGSSSGVGGGGGISGGSVLNANQAQFANLVNMKLRANSGSSQTSTIVPPETILNNNRIQASVMDLGKKLLMCVRDNDFNGVAAMMRKGAPFASDWLGMTAIHFAAMNNFYDICKLLLTSGINKDARTKVDRTPLHLAAFYGHERVAQLLIEYQCAVNPRDMLRMTPLHWAVEKRHKGIVRLLLKHHVDVTAISKFGKTPIALAVLTEQADILQELEAARQLQQSQKYNEEHEPLADPLAPHSCLKLELTEKETNEAVNSIMGQSKDDDEPMHKKLKMSSEEEKTTKTNLRSSLDDINDAKVYDNPAINLLKSHGISMMKDDDDTSNNLLTTALQNGRQLVLSEGGKLLLNEARRMGGNKLPETIKSTPNSQASLTTSQAKTEPGLRPTQGYSASKFRPNIIQKQKDTKESTAKDIGANNNNRPEPYKNIRIISLNDFKKLYGSGNLKSLQKFETSLNKSQVVKIKTDDKKVLPHRKSIEEIVIPDPITLQDDSENPDEDEESDLPPNIVKVSAESEQEDSSDVEVQTTIIHPPAQQSPEPRLLPVRNLSTTNTSRLSYSRPSSVANTIDVKPDRTPVIPLLTIPEICRQLLELRKQNDELRRKYEIAHKEKEDLRNRLERLETLLLVEHTEDDYSEM